MGWTYSIEGTGVIANCDALTDTASGTWSAEGGGTVSLSNDVYLIGGAAIGSKYASKDGVTMLDKGAATYDFTASTGTEAGELLYIWVSATAIGTLDVLSTYPFCIRLSSGSTATAETTDYVDFLVAGNDDSNGWTGGWKCFVIDPTQTPSRYNGTIATIIANVRSIGLWIDCSTSARADSFFIGGMAIGSGLRVKDNGSAATTTTGWADVVSYCTAYATRGWGMWQEREGIYYSYGKTIIGDSSSQTSTISFSDTGKIIQFGTSEYCTNAATGVWSSAMNADASGITIEDHSSYTTTFNDGTVVGTEDGRAGSTVLGNSLLNIDLDLYGGNNTSSVTTLHGTTIANCTGTVNSGNDAQHKFLGVSMAGCEQFDPVGAPVIRNCSFAETVSTDAAVVWNANIDIEDCNFIANTTGAGMEHPAQGSFNYVNLDFAGNTYDVLYSAAASSGVLTINKDSDSTVSTSEMTNPTGNSVSMLNSVNINIYVKDEDNNAVENAAVAVYQTSDDTQLMNEFSAATTGLATETFNHTVDTAVYIRVRKSSTGTRYYPVKTTGTISSSGLTVTVVLIEDSIVA